MGQSKIDIISNPPLFKGKCSHDFVWMFFLVFYLSSVVAAISSVGSSFGFICIWIFLGLPFQYLLVNEQYFHFSLFNDFLFFKYPLKFKNRTKIILLKDIEYLEYRNDNGRGRARGIIIIYPKKNTIVKRQELYFDDFGNNKVFAFLRKMYSMGIEIDISKCKQPGYVLKRIKSDVK
ncbi:hypothetical protein SAMN05660236_1877 [Ohtaekwangia koreensis]|uniref:Uncharacterized protein n=1 Tax=Ohtaekwangia koreensis TaxID=688867 RepID=A0A1T5K6J2_9BACT|nr:hypothetical protein SAMN05660236_1877 [Ohtaekwangia koreensis]